MIEDAGTALAIPKEEEVCSRVVDSRHAAEEIRALAVTAESARDAPWSLSIRKTSARCMTPAA